MKMKGCIRMGMQAGYLENVVITIRMSVISMIIHLIAIHPQQLP